MSFIVDLCNFTFGAISANLDFFVHAVDWRARFTLCLFCFLLMFFMLDTLSDFLFSLTSASTTDRGFTSVKAVIRAPFLVSSAEWYWKVFGQFPKCLAFLPVVVWILKARIKGSSYVGHILTYDLYCSVCQKANTTLRNDVYSVTFWACISWLHS